MPEPVTDPAREPDPTIGALVADLSQQTQDLVRGEMALARAELSATVRHATKGAGLFGGAGLVALYGLGALVAAVIAALGLALPLWVSALVVGLLLLGAAGVVALLGKKQVDQVTPAVPATQANVARDVAAIKEGRHRD